MVTIPTSQILDNLTIASNSWIVVTNQTLTINSNALISAGGGIIADRTGNTSGTGSGAGRYDTRLQAGSGAGYGGAGGAVSGSTSAPGGACYGSVDTPRDMGSGGGGYSSSSSQGGSGGGNLGLTINGILALDGAISANGGPGTGLGAGGGSGGTVSLTVNTISGTGIISANGGEGYLPGAGGGGGRISLRAGKNVFSGSLMARGGGGSNRGGAGTIYTALSNQQFGQVLVDNGGQPGALTLGSIANNSISVRITDGATWQASGYQTLNLNELTIGPNGRLVFTNQPDYTLRVNATSIRVDAGGAILADGSGYSGGSGSGAGGYVLINSAYAGGGGGYGGYGASVPGGKPTGGRTYGVSVDPTYPGSGGGAYPSSQGGPGGGRIMLAVSGPLVVDGRISANGLSGTNSGAGGGSGGSIQLTSGTLTGSGLISANGGCGLGLGGGGGGGRISITTSTNAFTGTLSAFGAASGNGTNFGGAGTLYFRPSNQSVGTLLLDNGQHFGSNTPLDTAGVPNLVVRSGAIAQPAPSQLLASLLVASNGWVVFTNQSVSINANATILPGGGILADGTGSFSAQGPGAGVAYASPGYGTTAGGGGYGGYGSRGAGSTNARGGISYGTMTAPRDLGSGGGSSPSVLYGGSGGGAIRLTVSGALSVGGRISAEGTAGLAPGAGGGSGGSIWITAGTLTGSGLISANGGSGNGWGGGGGGGRIALECTNTLFNGLVSAYGGEGSVTCGGAGTVYRRTLPGSIGQIVVDNGARDGMNTALPTITTPFDLIVRNGASVCPFGSSLLLSNLVIGAGGTFTWRAGTAGPSRYDLAVINDATVEVGGAIRADGTGYPAGNGPGAGLSTSQIGSGAGHGGSGGASSRLPGGPAYGSVSMPTDRGSGGGLGILPASGGEGGGAIRLSVGRALTLNGTLSANGNPGLVDDSGGGAGGSVWIDAGLFTGIGQLIANGGDGQLYEGGGGAGGRIAIYSPMNFFAGTTSTDGGAGFHPGTSGSIYSTASRAPFLVSAQSPASTITGAVSRIDLTLTCPIDPSSAGAAEFSLLTPSGPVPRSSCSITALEACGVRVTFPAQTAEGGYALTFGPTVRDFEGNALSQVYTGQFTLAWPQVHGMVTDTNNRPVAGVLMLANSGVTAALTDTNGVYSLKLPAGVERAVVPSRNGLVFVPSAIHFPNLEQDYWGQDFQAYELGLFNLSLARQGANLVATWNNVEGVPCQVLESTNLVHWHVCGEPLLWTNGPRSVVLPVSGSPAVFYRLELLR